MRASLVAGCLLLVIVVASGCAPEDPTQRAVRERVEAHVRALPGYDGDAHCTRTPSPWLVERATSVYLCAVRRDDGDCDRFSATIVGPDALRIVLDERRAGCVLPV